MEGLGALLVVVGVLLIIAVWTDTGQQMVQAIFG